MNELYSKIISLFDEYQKSETPISNIGHANGFTPIDCTNENEYYRAIKKDGEYSIILSIVSFEHDRTFQIRPDTYHNIAYLFKCDKQISSNPYMYEN